MCLRVAVQLLLLKKGNPAPIDADKRIYTQMKARHNHICQPKCPPEDLQAVAEAIGVVVEVMVTLQPKVISADT